MWLIVIIAVLAVIAGALFYLLDTQRLSRVETVSKILMPLIILFLGWMLSHSYKVKEQELKQIELNQKYIEIAVGILNSKPAAETTLLRDWAIDIIDRYSEIKLSKEAKKILKEKALPKPHTIDDIKNFDAIKDFDGIK